MADGRAAAHGLWSALQAEHERYREAVSYLPTDRIRLQEDLRRYLCLRCAGFLEQVTREVLDEFLVQKSSGPAQAFARSQVKVPNLRYEPFLKLVERFGNSYRDSLSGLLTGPTKDALDDLFDMRNDIAHGKYAGGRRLDPERYMRLSEDVYDWLVDTFLMNSVSVLADDGRTRTGTTTAASRRTTGLE